MRKKILFRSHQIYENAIWLLVDYAGWDYKMRFYDMSGFLLVTFHYCRFGGSILAIDGSTAVLGKIVPQHTRNKLG